jgi:hypothetical protein
MLGKKTLADLCAHAVTAVQERDSEALGAAHNAIARRIGRADVTEMTTGVAVLAPALADIPLGAGGALARLAGALVEQGADPSAVLETVVLRIASGLETAARLTELWDGDLPGPELVPEVLKRVGPEIAEAWFTVGNWIPALLVLLQSENVRKSLPHRQRITAAVTATREHIDDVEWAHGLLQVLDDEPIVVLHRDSGTGYEITIGGIGDNFQLHTLIADTLIGRHLPGTPPEPSWVAAATAGDLQPASAIIGQFNLVDAFGEWIWNEGRPADIPLLNDRRVVVLDPPPYKRSWNIGRVYPLMRPSITLTRVLSTEETAQWLAQVKTP